MKSYTTLRNLYGSLTNNVESANLTLGDQLINDSIRTILGKSISWKFLETSATQDTVASQQGYFKPYDCDKIIAIKVANGSVEYMLSQIKSRDDFNLLTDIDLESDYITHFYVDDRKVLLYPTPDTSGNDITIYYKKRVIDLANADYTTGTISVTNASATVTGSGTTFTAAMVGRYLKVNNDGYWYKITGYTSATVITLEQAFQGTTVAGANYTIGEMSVLPENYQEAPVYSAVSQYWFLNKQPVLGQLYEKMFLEKVEEMKKNNITSTFDVGINSRVELINPNDYPTIT